MSVSPYRIPSKAKTCSSTRSFIENLCENHADQLDFVASELLDEIELKIDCRQCGQCCKEAYPVIEEADKAALSEALSVSSQQLSDDYLLKDEDGNQVFKTQVCPLLAGTECSAYQSRMKGCREYPHLRQSNFAERSALHQYNYSKCPQVYHLVESLKLRFLEES
tara:strand:+ start:279 stop:773 length:495 start_codon:yes stop_codon:yes gene_type:complete